MAILSQNTVSLSYLSSSFPLRKVDPLPIRSPSLSCPDCINQSVRLPWLNNISTPADWRKPTGRKFLSLGCRATDSKKPPSVSGFENCEGQDADGSESSSYEDLEEKTSNILAGVNGGLRAELSCEEEKVAQELYNLEEETIADDEGRSPSDYNRRAHIFDKSAQMFSSPIHKDRNDLQDVTQ